MSLVAASGNGSAPSTATNRKNNGGVILQAGTIASNGLVITDLGILTEAQYVGASYGSKVVVNDGTGANTTDRAGVSGVNPSVALPYKQVPTGWIMMGVGVTTTIGGVANNALLTGGADYLGSGQPQVFKLNSTRLLGSGVTQTLNIYARPSGIINPAFSRGGGAGNKENFVMATDGTTTAVDNAIGSIHLPGELTYNFGGLNLPSSGNYKPHDVFES